MGGWGNATRHGGWRHVGRTETTDFSRVGGRWTAPDVLLTVVAFVIHWELGLAFLSLKLWQQASGYQGTMFAFAKEKWESLVGATRLVLSGTALPFAIHVGSRSSGNHAFDTWRQTELSRIEAERAKLRVAEREFASYRDELLHAKDREDFDRFMQARGTNLR